jgi:hypothetical protein
MNGVKLYGIFVKQGEACLCPSAYPAAVWDLENAAVPEKMATSPAVCFTNKLWLVGGSTADPRNVSNQVWSYKEGLWSKHANGNALNEVWSSDMQGKWQRHPLPPSAAWSPRCMQAVTIFQNRIWMYGGVSEPFGNPLEDIWKSPDVKEGTPWDGATWEPYKFKPQHLGQPIGKPLGCTLQVVNGQLHLFGTFSSGTSTNSMNCLLLESQARWSSSLIQLENSWDQQGGNTFSLLSTEYKGLVFLRSLNYQTADNPTSLHVYVP